MLNYAKTSNLKKAQERYHQW
jgi:hypothetical protein